MIPALRLNEVRLDATKNNQQKGVKGQKIMKYKEPMVGIEPTTNALRKHCSTAELHRLIICYKHVYYGLVAPLTLAIIPFACSPCQAFFTPLACIASS